MSIKFEDKGAKTTIVFIPGWGTDSSIFKKITGNWNSLYIDNEDPFEFSETLSQALSKHNIHSVILFGFSMGGFMALDYAASAPKSIKKVILTGVRQQYAEEEMKSISKMIKQNKKGFMAAFYKSCFNEIQAYKGFKSKCLPQYLSQFSKSELVFGLHYLADTAITQTQLKKLPKITFCHGKSDNVAPINEVR
mgnify:CR=1 FL=1